MQLAPIPAQEVRVRATDGAVQNKATIVCNVWPIIKANTRDSWHRIHERAEAAAAAWALLVLTEDCSCRKESNTEQSAHTQTVRTWG